MGATTKKSKCKKVTYSCSNLQLLRAAGFGDKNAIESLSNNCGVYYHRDDAPMWLQNLFDDTKQCRLLLREWEDNIWRLQSGWIGNDLVHSPGGQAVSVQAYFWHAESQELSGIVHFGPDAESHRGLCHGGAMTSLFDDVLGHIAFVIGTKPWAGATVQIDCSLSKPIIIGDTCKIVGKIEKIEKKKIFVSAILSGCEGSVYAIMRGLSVCPVEMSSIDDAISHRRWLDIPRVLLDSGWQLPLKIK
jgi:acyl-coenzyme A thioesterase PaaI-like protein